jgi:hypothetical protein
MVAIDQFLEVMPLEGFYSFPDFFFSLLTDIHLIFATLLCHTKIQIKLEFGSDPLIFHEVMALGLGKNHELSVLSTFFSHIHLIYCFAIPRYRLSLSLALIY